MPELSLLRPVDLPFCQVLMFEEWDAPPGRFFLAYRARGSFSKLLGQGVIDEFRTISGPILISPAATIGGIYDAGMLLADERDVEAPIDQGWPPLTIGIDTPAIKRSKNWQAELLAAMKSRKSTAAPPWNNSAKTGKAGDFRLESFCCATSAGIAMQLFVCDAPMLPQQLQRLADLGEAPFTAAVSTGNRLPRVSDGILHDVAAVSEDQLAKIIAVAKRLSY